LKKIFFIIHFYYIKILGIVSASDPVWKDIRELLSSAMTVKAIHLFVYEGRHFIWEKLGLPSVKPPSSCTSPQKQLTPNEDGNKLYFSV